MRVWCGLADEVEDPEDDQRGEGEAVIEGLALRAACSLGGEGGALTGTALHVAVFRDDLGTSACIHHGKAGLHEGGEAGGYLVAAGTPEHIATVHASSHTGVHLRRALAAGREHAYADQA